MAEIKSFADIPITAVFNTNSSSAARAAQQTAAGFDKLEKQLAEMQRIKAEQSKITDVAEFQKDTRDLAVDNNMTARDVGLLRKNVSRLNVFSALAKNDAVDNFKFRVATAGEVKIGMLNASGESDIRVQIFKKGSTLVVADNGAPADSAAKKAYDDAAIGALNLGVGDYVIRITRMDESYSAKSKEFSYALQLSMGTFRQDFDTVEKTVDPNADPFGMSQNVGTTNLMSMMSSSYNFINSLQPIGYSATSKMQAAIYQALL